MKAHFEREPHFRIFFRKVKCNQSFFEKKMQLAKIMSSQCHSHLNLGFLMIPFFEAAVLHENYNTPSENNVPHCELTLP